MRSFLGILGFLIARGMCNCLHGDLRSKANLYFKGLWLMWARLPSRFCGCWARFWHCSCYLRSPFQLTLTSRMSLHENFFANSFIINRNDNSHFKDSIFLQHQNWLGWKIDVHPSQSKLKPLQGESFLQCRDPCSSAQTYLQVLGVRAVLFSRRDLLLQSVLGAPFSWMTGLLSVDSIVHDKELSIAFHQSYSIAPIFAAST